jgi:DNA invertase Pin-like site-specific DNA recombinase
VPSNTSLRAALYARVSTTDQSTSLQIDEGKGIIERKGWSLSRVYEDVGWSGSKAKRPALEELLSDARKGKFKILVVWRADRLFRSVAHMVSTLAELSALGIDFVSCTENFDTSTPTGRLLFHLVSAFGQFERDIIIERTRAGMAAAQRRGISVGRKRTRVDVEEARALVGEGISVRQAAKQLGVAYSVLQRALARDGDPKGSSPMASETPAITPSPVEC